MNRNSYIALLIAFLLGVGLGGYLMYDKDKVVEDHSKEYVEQLAKSKKAIDSLYVSLAKKDSLLSQDSLDISRLEFKLKVAKAKNGEKREEAAKLNVVGKEKWLRNRYDSALTSDSTVTVLDTVAALVIDELIIKDGLVEELGIKDSVILEYKDVQKLLSGKVEELHEIIEEQEMINEGLGEENDDLQKELRKERRRRIVTTIVGGVVIGILIIL